MGGNGTRLGIFNAGLRRGGPATRYAMGAICIKSSATYSTCAAQFTSFQSTIPQSSSFLPVQPPCCSVPQSPPPQPHTAYDTRQWIATRTPTSSAAMTSPSRSRRSTSPHRKTRRIRATRKATQRPTTGACFWRSAESAPSVST